MRVFFSDDFKKSYKRNNKSAVRRNIKCFPKYREEHRDTGFCGADVEICVIPDPEMDIEKLTFYGSIEKKHDEFDPNNKIYFGEIKSINDYGVTINVVFNKRPRRWDYSWHSHRHTCKTMHCFRVLVLYDGRIVHRQDSDPFMIYTRKRKNKLNC